MLLIYTLSAHDFGLHVLYKMQRFFDILHKIFIKRDTFSILSDPKSRYRDVLGTNIFNCCWMIRLPAWAVRIGKVIGNYFDVVKFLLTVQIVIITLNFSDFTYKDELIAMLESFHHLCIVPMCTIVGLYMIFKQRRPCYDTKTQCQIGTLYGMPSGDALFSAFVGCYIAQKNVLLGVLFTLCVCFSRISRGYHTLLQVIVGSSFGVSIFFISRLFGDSFVLVNWIVSLFLPLLALFEPKLKEARKFDANNMHAWLFLDFPCVIFDFIICPPEKYDLFKEMKFEYKLSIHAALWILLNFIGYYISVNGISLSIV